MIRPKQIAFYFDIIIFKIYRDLFSVQKRFLDNLLIIGTAIIDMGIFIIYSDLLTAISHCHNYHMVELLSLSLSSTVSKS